MNTLLLVWRNSFRNASRFYLTSLSVAVAFFLFTLLAAINNALSVSVSGNNEYRLMTNHKISITRSLAVNYSQKIAALEGVKTVSYASWFGGFYQDETNQLAVSAVDHKNYFSLFNEYVLPSEQLTHWQNTRTGLIIGQHVADKYGWKIGDKIPLSSSIWMNKSGSFSWEFIVSGIYQKQNDSTDANRIFFQHAYFDKARAYAKNMVSWLSTGVKHEYDMNEVAQAIDKLFANSNAPTRTTTEQLFLKAQAQQFVDMAMVINIVLAAVFFTLLLIVCNSMIQANNDRLNENAMMKALGFSSTKLITQVYLESLLLLGVGALVGVILAIALMAPVKVHFADFLPGIAITTKHYFFVLISVFITAAICTFIPAVNIKRLQISQTLGAMA